MKYDKIVQVLSKIYYLIKNHDKTIRLDHGVHIGRNSLFEGYNTIYKDAYFCGRIGLCSCIGGNSKILGNVGRYCSIGENVKVEVYTHPTHTLVSTSPVFYSTRNQSGTCFTTSQIFNEELFNDEGVPVTIGNDVWIGSGVIIIGGIKIGDGAIIAAGAVVCKDVEPYSIVGGVPAKIIRYRFDEETVLLLQKFQWWDKDLNWLRKNVDLFKDISKLVTYIKSQGSEL